MQHKYTYFIVLSETKYVQTAVLGIAKERFLPDNFLENYWAELNN